MIYLMNRPDQPVRGNTFQKITAGSMLQSAENVFIIIKGCQNNNLYFRIVFFDNLGTLYAIHFRHSDIHQNYIRLIPPDSPDHLNSVCRSIRRKIRIAGQHNTKAVSYQFLVVCN